MSKDAWAGRRVTRARQQMGQHFGEKRTKQGQRFFLGVRLTVETDEDEAIFALDEEEASA